MYLNYSLLHLCLFYLVTIIVNVLNKYKLKSRTFFLFENDQINTVCIYYNLKINLTNFFCLSVIRFFFNVFFM